ncbi:MAG: hypothetical protein ACYC7E_02500 [Armatimonadota bacterium]
MKRTLYHTLMTGLLVGAGVWLTLGTAVAQDGTLLPSPVTGAYSLEQFGPITTAAQAEETLAKAAKILIAQGGGFLIIPMHAPANWRPENISQGTWRTPPPPAPANKGWGNTAGITLIDYRGGTPKLLVQQMDGLTVQRDFRMPEGESCGHWGYFPMLNLQNHIYRGTTSYRDWITEDVKAGKDRRFYVKTLRGIFPGMFLNSGDWGNVQRLYVKSIGYDPEKKAGYFVADTDADILAKNSIMHNKSHANVLYMNTYAHTENQTFDVFMNRHHYSQGDTYMFAGHFNYMGDVHSTAGDENGVIYAAFSLSETDIFRGQVDTFSAATHELKYKGAGNAHTLASGRPIINLNRQKWVTQGTVLIVRPGTWWNLDDTTVKDPVFQGKTYPTRLEKAEGTGIPELRIGGLIRFSKDAPVAPDVVGRYFAVDEKDEYVPGAATVRRWYLIHRVTVNPDGTKDMTIIRHWWGAKPAHAPTLYNPDNYTQDGHIKPLKYIIAPGANVYDVARGVKSGPAYSGGALERIIKLTPGSHNGTPIDFAANDPIEQAIGPDPFKPIPFRAWTFDAVPGVFPSPIFDVQNSGSISRYSVMTVAGGSSSLADAAKKPDKRPAWENILVVDSASGNGIVFGGDVANAALLFRQPNNRPQPIKWLYGDKSKNEATLTVSPTDGTMRYEGGGVALPGGLVNVSGLSGTATKAQNLRGVNVPVPAGAQNLTVKFPRVEADDGYAVFLELSWLTNKAITQQTQEGFVVKFETPPPADAKLHWILVR